jgi:uncharacterized protein
MTQFPMSAPLTDAELESLDHFLIEAGAVIENVEMLDGFLAALVIGPELVMPSDYLGLIIGDGETSALADMEEANRVLSLLMRHWNAIAGTLAAGKVWGPIIAEDEAASPGCDWARGFLTGVDLTRDAWQPFLDDEEQSGAIVAVLMLAHEHDPDEALRPPPIRPALRDDLILHLAAGLVRMHRYFLAKRTGGIAHGATRRRSRPAQGGGARKKGKKRKKR